MYVYTDGACRGNPGKGGWAFIILDPTNNNTVIDKGSSGVLKTTNNRMELTAALEALKRLESSEHPNHITMHVDSKYVIDGITSWIVKWKKNKWLTSAKKPVMNEDLWKELDYFNQKFVGRISWEWVEGHAGNVFNELVDTMAKAAVP